MISFKSSEYFPMLHVQAGLRTMPIMSAPAALLAADCGQEKCRLNLVPSNKETRSLRCLVRSLRCLRSLVRVSIV